jgi:hypothetical protein
VYKYNLACYFILAFAYYSLFLATSLYLTLNRVRPFVADESQCLKVSFHVRDAIAAVARTLHQSSIARLLSAGRPQPSQSDSIYSRSCL